MGWAFINLDIHASNHFKKKLAASSQTQDKQRLELALDKSDQVKKKKNVDKIALCELRLDPFNYFPALLLHQFELILNS